jgi:hypothetical protein
MQSMMYLMFGSFKEMNRALERVRKVLESVE